MKRVIAGSIVTLLLAVTSMAAACDLSCAFAMASSDCHASESTATSAGSADAMAGMDGVAMSGMAMPGASDSATPPSTSDMSPTKAAHPSIGDMGPCERQSCDKGSFVSVRAGRSGAARMNLILPLARNAMAGVTPRISYGARDDGARFPSFKVSPLSTILRV